MRKPSEVFNNIPPNPVCLNPDQDDTESSDGKRESFGLFLSVPHGSSRSHFLPTDQRITSMAEIQNQPFKEGSS
jgi:hypothetical protein